MKRNRSSMLLNAALGPVLALSPACAGSSPRGAERAAPSAQNSTPDVATLLEAHDVGWNAHDPELLTALYVADGTLVTPTGARVEGRAALREMFASPGPTKQTSSSSTLESVQFLADDLALIDARQKLTGPGVEMLGSSEARLTAVVRLVNDEWRFVAARPYLPVTR